MEKEIYTFPDILTHQPSGFRDVSKITNPTNVLVTYTNMDNGKQERDTIQRIDIDDDKGCAKSLYIYIAKTKCVKKIDFKNIVMLVSIAK